MNDFDQKSEGKKKVDETKTFPVLFSLGEIKTNITINTNSPSKPSKEQIINQAFNFHSQGNISEAAKLYQDFINKGFNDHRVFSNHGVILQNLGKSQDAEISYRKAIKIKPDYAEAHYNLGTHLKAIDKLKDAELSYVQAIKINPNYAEAHCNLGNILRDMGKLQEAELSYLKAIEIKPDFADAYFNLGNILEELGKSEEAIKIGETAVRLNPENETALISLAHRLCFAKKYELALKYLHKNKSNSCQILYLGCLLSLDREIEFNEKFKELSRKKICNANIGGIIEHANIIYQKNYNSPFCNEAINYVLIDKIDKDSFSQNDLNKLIAYTQDSKTRMRAQGTLKGGVQTSGDLFSLDLPFVLSMKKALEEKIELYKNKFKDSGQGFIENWPIDYELRSWMINMKSGGFLAPHNHEYGWITGSFYLKLPKITKNKELGRKPLHHTIPLLSLEEQKLALKDFQVVKSPFRNNLRLKPTKSQRHQCLTSKRLDS